MAAPTGQTLEALVRDELRAPVQEIVRRLIPEPVAEALNGSAAGTAVYGPENVQEATHGPGRTTNNPPASTVLKTCKACGEAKAPTEFEVGRSKCRACRRADARARQQSSDPADDEEPHPAPTPQRGRRGQRRLEQDRHWDEQGRRLIAEARAKGVTRELRDGREFVVLHLEPQFGLRTSGA